MAKKYFQKYLLFFMILNFLCFFTIIPAKAAEEYNWILADFESKTGKWIEPNGNNMSFPIVQPPYFNVLRLQNSPGQTVEARRFFTPCPSDICNEFNRIELDINLHGAILDDGESSALGFEESGRKYVSLSNYVQQGLNKWQHITIPMSSISASGVDIHKEISYIYIKISKSSSITVDIDNISFKGAPICNFEQPPLPIADPGKSWGIQSIDTMHWSKDCVQYQKSQDQINNIINLDANLGATYIAIDCPYDDASYLGAVDGYKGRWLSAIRSKNLKVIHRQHWANWEGDYGKPKLTPYTIPAISLGKAEDVLSGRDTSSYLYKTYNYIKAHSNEYQAGDIIVPCAEPENAHIGLNTTDMFRDYQEFRKWLRDNITVCNEALSQSGLSGKVYIGLFGYSGWQALNKLDERTMDAMSFVGIDHYASDATTMSNDLNQLWNLYEKPIMITEWGNLWDSNENANAQRVTDVLTSIKNNNHVFGVNYWCDTGSNPSANNELIRESNLTYKPNSNSVKAFYIINK